MSLPSLTGSENMENHSGYHNEERTQINTNETAITSASSALTTHESDTTTHGATGAVVGTTNEQTLTNKTLTSPKVNEDVALTATATQLNRVDATSSIQDQLDAKSPIASPEFTGDVGLATGANITVNEADPDMIIELPAGAWSPTTTGGCADIATTELGTNDIDYKALFFDKGTQENAFTTFRMPTNWDGGVVQFSYTWTVSGGGSADILEMELGGRSYADGDAGDQAVGTYVGLQDTWQADNDIHVSGWSSDVTLAGSPAGGQYVYLRIRRDVANDDLDNDARLIGVQIKYKTKQYSN